MYEKAKVNPIVPLLENNDKPKDNNTNEEHPISHPKNESDETQFPQTGEQIISSMWRGIGIALSVSSVFIYIKIKKLNDKQCEMDKYKNV